MAQKQQMRNKIKKLKYKLQKQQSLNQILKQKVQHLNGLNRQELTIEKVMKKIAMLLGHKGLTITDWFFALSYHQKQYVQNYAELLDQMGIKLDRGERSLLLHFLTGDLSETISFEHMGQMAVKAGLRIE